MNLLLVVLWAFALPYPRFRPMASCLSTVWSCIIIVCKMLYQLKVVNPQEYSSNCSEVLGHFLEEVSSTWIAKDPLSPSRDGVGGTGQRLCHAEGRDAGQVPGALSAVRLLLARRPLPSPGLWPPTSQTLRPFP